MFPPMLLIKCGGCSHLFEGDPETRRKVGFSIAMIALSAKMAKADGVVTNEEVEAFSKFLKFQKMNFKTFQDFII